MVTSTTFGGDDPPREHPRQQTDATTVAATAPGIATEIGRAALRLMAILAKGYPTSKTTSSWDPKEND
jgi:hypothetical protein